MFSIFRRKAPAPPLPAEPTFSERVSAFWKWFEEVAPRFYATIEEGKCADLTDETSDNIDKHLTDFAWVYGPGENGNGHALTITAEGNQHRRLLLQYWLSRAPKLTGWTFYSSHQPGKLHDIILDSNNTRFKPLEFWVTPSVNEEDKKIDLTVWHPLFDSMPKNQRGTVLFLYLDKALGEEGTERWIGEIKQNNSQLAQSMPMTELRNYVQEQQAARGWKHLPFGESGCTYRGTNDSETTYPRSDIVAGSTVHFQLIRDYGRAEGQLTDPLAGTGADFIYVSFPRSILPKGEEVAWRGRVEDALEESLRQSAGGRSLGGALGAKSAYIDLLILDGKRSLDVIGKVIREELPRGTTINYFAKEKASQEIVI